ncbi:hypothetical protein BDV06DRAFT_226106 [Aspergillus oleicola]
MFLSVLEPTLSIIIACMPFFPTFIARLRRRHRQHRQFFSLGSYGHSQSGSGGSRTATYGNSYSAAAGTNAMAAPPPRYPASAKLYGQLGRGKRPHTHHRLQEGGDEDVILLA